MLKWSKKISDRAELKSFKESIRKNPNDIELRMKFIKYCLRKHFKHQQLSYHATEAVNQFESIAYSKITDVEVFYLMGKFYEGNDDKKTQAVYRQGIELFNKFAKEKMILTSDFVELAFAMALNLLKLEQYHPGEELKQFFKIVKKRYLKPLFDEKKDFSFDLPPFESDFPTLTTAN